MKDLESKRSCFPDGEPVGPFQQPPKVQRSFLLLVGLAVVSLMVAGALWILFLAFSSTARADSMTFNDGGVLVEVTACPKMERRLVREVERLTAELKAKDAELRTKDASLRDLRAICGPKCKMRGPRPGDAGRGL